MTARILVGDCRDRLAELAAGSVQTCVTSPPYFRLRSYLPNGHADKHREIGTECSVDSYVAELVAVFRAVRRVLRDDGTLWLNLGSSFGPGKQELFVPHRVAIALQADGWVARADIIWAKPNPMPESVRDRPTKSHEYLFLLTKQPRYFWDAEAAREPNSDTPVNQAREKYGEISTPKQQANRSMGGNGWNPASVGHYRSGGRNIRSVWTIALRPTKLAHFAAFPPALVEPCVKAGTSERGGCPACGAPWRRVVETGGIVSSGPNGVAEKSRSRDRHAYDGDLGDRPPDGYGGLPRRERRTVDWAPSCPCDAGAPVAQTVLDPFAGSGTVGEVANLLGRRFVGIELHPGYAEMARARIAKAQGPMFADVDVSGAPPG
ncbi:MAG: site-specific DNA-methyltransferase [Pseudomonadota bacterium]|nr:site-specific DNA-methyltransferase [Pseudomonadota bacterium]